MNNEIQIEVNDFAQGLLEQITELSRNFALAKAQIAALNKKLEENSNTEEDPDGDKAV